jgi:hypothetical protein
MRKIVVGQGIFNAVDFGRILCYNEIITKEAQRGGVI